MNAKISLRVTWLSIALIAAVSPAPAHTQQQASPSACYVPGSGTMYLIKRSDTPESCWAGHVEFSLAAATGSMAARPASAAVAAALPTNSQGAVDLSNVNGFVATGTWGTGKIPATGSGTRLMWYPRKGALRAGTVAGSQWDDVNIGSGSVAFGLSSIASGTNAFAAGTNSVASGNSAFAMGFLSGATGNYSAAVGYGAKAEGSASIALGHEAWADGDYGSIAVGLKSVASGQASAALGHTAKAGGNFSIALGEGPSASGGSSVSIGAFSKAPGQRGIAMGYGATASGYEAIAVGQTVASGNRAIAIGNASEANGSFSIAMGNFAFTNGRKGAFVYGDASSASQVKAAADNQFVVRAQRFWFGNHSNVTATAGRFIETSTGAYLSTGGVWVSASDSTRKHLWEDVDGESVLEKLAGLPVRTWSYRAEDSTVRHMGPTAQEFHAAFDLGDSDKGIGSVDADGVALAAIKALVQRTNELRRENEELRAALVEVSRWLAELESGRK